jgi:hypothetical protein
MIIMHTVQTLHHLFRFCHAPLILLIFPQNPQRFRVTLDAVDIKRIDGGCLIDTDDLFAMTMKPALPQRARLATSPRPPSGSAA